MSTLIFVISTSFVYLHFIEYLLTFIDSSRYSVCTVDFYFHDLFNRNVGAPPKKQEENKNRIRDFNKIKHFDRVCWSFSFWFLCAFCACQTWMIFLLLLPFCQLNGCHKQNKTKDIWCVSVSYEICVSAYRRGPLLLSRSHLILISHSQSWWW